MINIALIGNPNSGKTTLFNALTGTYQKTGNWTGVTTESKSGLYKKNKDVKIIDLPGVYALEARSPDERVVLEYLKKQRPDLIINILDGTNLERNLFLTTELLRLGIPMVLAINMCDELEKNGLFLKQDILSDYFGTPVVMISALKGKNIDLLIKEVIKTNTPPKQVDISKLEGATDTEKRFNYIESVLENVIEKKRTKSQIATEKIDKVLMHKFLGLPIFFSVIALIYFLSIKAGGLFGGVLEIIFQNFSETTSNSLNKIGAKPWVSGLLCDSVINGVGAVVSFLPQILILFALLTILEQSGYASRIAFILDRFLSVLGLGGKSFIPMIVCCGCTVTGLTATRTIENKCERDMTIFLSPFMPCGAKMAVFGWFSAKFFNGNPFVATSTYFLSVLVIALTGRILKRFKRFCGNGGFVLEIPPLRVPAFKDIVFVLWEKSKDFLLKAGSIIFLTSIVLWLLTNFGFHGYTDGYVERSFLYGLGQILKYIFYPLGFFNWETSVAIITGFMAKEAVIETLEIVVKDYSMLFSNGWSVYSFMSFVLLAPPCLASIFTAKRELGNNKNFILMLLFQTLIAYSVAFLINGIGCLWENGLILYLVLGIILLIFVLLTIKMLRSTKKEWKHGV